MDTVNFLCFIWEGLSFFTLSLLTYPGSGTSCFTLDFVLFFYVWGPISFTNKWFSLLRLISLWTCLGGRWTFSVTIYSLQTGFCIM
ncbi:hypothetical protein QBC42DRAFT_2494 [Cladorrhinum samala]|uniref:Uncharacterized protein n=1 Tax=Cladorrhinum samala TaxID=585594 RepID=A0AAV9I241_9PEZI|nr:hypothetical protein QBC42DRAFT_2494 [Cladorrhinum samala]